MHLLQSQGFASLGGEQAVDTGQTPGDIVFLSAADSELALLAAAHARLRRAAAGAAPSLRLFNLMRLGHNLSVDLYAENVAAHARLVVVRLLGGVSYWPYGVERLVQVCRDGNIPLALLPGDDAPDAELAALSSLDAAAAQRLWQYCIHGGAGNAGQLLRFAACLLGHALDWREPAPLPRAGIFWPGEELPGLERIKERWRAANPASAGAATVGITFYRALALSGTLAAVEALAAALLERGLNPLPVFVASLKDAQAASIAAHLLQAAGAELILNATGFAVAPPGESAATPFNALDCPVLQVIFAGGTRQEWQQGSHGLSPRDLAMNVALPEVDGRLITRAVAFKTPVRRDAATQCDVVGQEADAGRISYVADLAAAWLRLRRCEPRKRRTAVILANYPNRDGRMGNGVGLDTPASVVHMLRQMAEAGHAVADIPADGNALMRRIAEGPTNAAPQRNPSCLLQLQRYRDFLSRLPQGVRDEVNGRWGAPEQDPFFLAQRRAFAIPAFRCGNVAVGLQPARGYNIDPAATYHDPDLPPPHGYLAFYAWLRLEAKVHAVVHAGKHGNLEWLPGKALCLSEECLPDAVLGPLPHIYPFIVNDPGEGSQAKRRVHAAIVDHMTPPMTRAETYGPLAELEALVDEYYEAAGLDPRRARRLGEDIIDAGRRMGLDRDCGIGKEDSTRQALARIDAHLCDLKEMQIRDGLHVFGRPPPEHSEADLLAALVRVPRGGERPQDASLLRALAQDLRLGDYDPLRAEAHLPWEGPRPAALAGASGDVWRSRGDTLERLEMLARDLVAGRRAPEQGWRASRAVLSWMRASLRPMLARCGAGEMRGLLHALEGGFVAPGPSGAPTRGRIDVLPTGRNFHSLDSRSVPTPAAWRLGFESAGLLVDHYRQLHGEWPRAMALSLWGTANMRTGGDDVAQALALMGARPRWETRTRRVVGFEILPLSVLERPRVDVTLRVSGFFRDAFPAQMDLLQDAARAVMALDEPEDKNPLAAQQRRERARLLAGGMDEAEAERSGGLRVFGPPPRAYGAGLQALIDEGGWEERGDLARAYMIWSAHAYGGGARGEAAGDAFRRRLERVQAVIQNQDNREHDILDSDDYYQFEGGMAAAVEQASGAMPSLYHNDHSRPERPLIRLLGEEIGRVVRGRAGNPKWIAGVMRHGYKGAFEMAATVDYLFAFAATTDAVGDHHFDALFQAYLQQGEVVRFLRENNPEALREMALRFGEAIRRGLWHPASNAVHGELEAMLAQAPNGARES